VPATGRRRWAVTAKTIGVAAVAAGAGAAVYAERAVVGRGLISTA
jgi:hypothetical protein